MGEHFIQVESPAALSATVRELPGAGRPTAQLLAIECLDARGADGYSRKYRVMMIFACRCEPWRSFSPGLDLQPLDIPLDGLGEIGRQVVEIGNLDCRCGSLTTSLGIESARSRVRISTSGCSRSHCAKLSVDRSGNRSTTFRSSISISIVP